LKNRKELIMEYNVDKLLVAYSEGEISETHIKTLLDINHYEFIQLLRDHNLNYNIEEKKLTPKKRSVLKELLNSQGWK